MQPIYQKNRRVYASGVSSFTFLSVFVGSASLSALRFPTLGSSGAAFFFFLTMDVRSLTMAGAAFDADDDPPAFSSRSRAWAARAGALVASDSFGDVFNSSTCIPFSVRVERRIVGSTNLECQVASQAREFLNLTFDLVL